MKKFSEDTIKQVADLNEQLFDAEQKVSNQENVVRAARFYFAAEPTQERLLDLRGAMANLRAEQANLDNLRTQFSEYVKNVYALDLGVWKWEDVRCKM